jgi:uncharacterized membrane protein YfcA
MTTVAILAGVGIGAALGLLGGGGSVLTVPVFTYLLGFDPKQAIPMSLAVVGLTSAVGTASAVRDRRVNVRVGLVLGTAALFGTLVGVQLARFVTGATQLLVFAAVVLTVAASVLRSAPTASTTTTARKTMSDAIRAMSAGLVVGVLTGFVGVGGGFVIVPTLMMMRLPFVEAVGTSLLIITVTCLVGLLGYYGRERLDWTAVALVAAGTLPGILVGTRWQRVIPEIWLRRAFAVLLFMVAALIIVEHVRS